MTRSTFRPLRTRRLATNSPASRPPKSAPSRAARSTVAALGAICLAFAASSAVGAPAESAPALSSAQAADHLIVRGRYLVEHVGLCADCHSPRNEKGEFIRELWLMGATLPFSPFPNAPKPVAPPLAGLPTMNETQAVAFLQTGKRPDGSQPRPPMPPYRLNEADAQAVVAYLKSLAK